MEAKFYLKKSNQIEGLIYVSFNRNSVQVRISTGRKIKVIDWSNGGLISKSNNVELRNELATWKVTFDNYIKSVIAKEKRQPTANELQHFVKSTIQGIITIDSERSIKDVIETFLSEQRVKLAIGTITYKEIHLTHFTDFVGSKTISDISKRLLTDYKSQLIGSVRQTTTTNSYLKTVKSFLTWLYDNDYTTLNFSKYLKKDTEIEKPVIALTNEELTILENATELPEFLQQQIDIFLLLCYTACDISTAKQITKERIKNDMIEIRRVKTSQLINIPLLPEAKTLLEKYDYKMPFISDNKGNENLKDAFKLLGLNRPVRMSIQTAKGFEETLVPLCDIISWHKGRKTAITTALSAQINPSVVMGLSGHSDYRTMKKYIAYSDEVLKTEMSKMSRSSRSLKKVS